MYPEEQPYPSLIEAEARHQITRLSSHPSVALWCGGNECTWGYESWGWKERLKPDQSWGRGYYLDLLPRLIKELDPTRPCWPNSPWSGSETIHSNEADRGDRHTWDVKADGYRAIVPRFCSEFGHQAPANYATLARALGLDELRLGSRGLEHRQRGTGGMAKHIAETLEQWFRPPRDFDEWHYLSQLAQARALQTGIEWMRVNQPRCMGALVWQLNDAWPGMSWSLVDADGREKPAWHAVAAAFKARLLTIQPFDGRPLVCVVNDTDEPWEGHLDLRRMSLEGTILATAKTIPFSVSPRAAARLADVGALVGPPSDPTREMVVAEMIKRRRHWYYLPDKDLAYPEPRLDAKVTRAEDGVTGIRCVARSMIRDAVFPTDRIGPCEPADLIQLQTLLPGDTVAFSLKDAAHGETPAAAVSAAQVSKPPLFWCANWYGRPA